MGWISEVFVHKAIDAAGVDGVQRAGFYQIARVDPKAPFDPKAMIPDSVFFDLLETLVAKTDQGRSIPVRIGASMRCDDYGAFGLAFKSAPDLLGSYKRVERFGKVVTSIANFRVVERGATTLMEVIPDHPARLGLTMTNELAVAAALALSKEVSAGLITPLTVHLSLGAPADDRAQQAHFGCPVHYDSPRDALEIETAVLQRPNRVSDAGISAFFDAHLNAELGKIGDPSSLSAQVMDQISEALSEGVPTLGYVAERLGMSTRTLQRRLADAGLAYQDLVAAARQRLASTLLHETDYALSEIAFLTGYSDQSAFNRAFKRWFGQTPASARRRD
ncbi:AraC family transcriptional regulator [Actibacterium pelagium]|uniref:AraC family transcriptional regulator n=2 Tax=Actibacterium pelagium TaxID=2029103 RepID=A0A917ALV5_9RHOB|nr:AraC family transcriptional regulator [Actibacterium pelagium]GGE57729.1 AraC family transcriptional regulator [Actibacterium pelagium]